MKKKILTVLICGVIVFTFIWSEKKSDKITLAELNVIQDRITDIVSSESMGDYHNFASCYVDEGKKKVIVELIDNSKKEQEWFRNNILASKYIKFKQGGPYYLSSSIDFYISKTDIHNDPKFNQYYTNGDRKIYLTPNIDQFYILDKSHKETLARYFSQTNQTFDGVIKSITDKMEKESTLRDGGTTIYKSKEKDVTMVVCNTLDKNKNIYIGDYSMEYEQSMCK